MISKLCIALGALLVLGSCGSVEKARKPNKKPPRIVLWHKGPLQCPPGTSRQTAPDDDDTCPRGNYEFCARPDGTRHGPFRGHHQNRRRCVWGQYVDGKQNGRWSWYFLSGNYDMMQCWDHHRVDWESRDLKLAKSTKCPR